MDELSAQRIVERSTRLWWLLVLAMLVGGLAGYAIHRAWPPVYEARAAFTITIDYTLTGKLDLTEEDIALAGAANLVRSTPVIEELIRQAQAEGLPVDKAYITYHSSFERKSEIWELAIRDSDPSTAARVVNLWAGLGLERLQEASLHAQKAASIRRLMAAEEDCLQHATAAVSPDSACSVANLASLQAGLDASAQALQEELTAAGSFTPAVRFALSKTANAPLEPTRRGTNSMVLAGALIGLITAGWAVQAISGRLASRLNTRG